jgi:hypothetical protein
MSEHDTKIRNLLDDLAGEVRLDPTLGRSTLRRARRRRAGNVAATLVVVVGLVTGGAVAARELRHQAVPASTPTPSLLPTEQSPEPTNGNGSVAPSASPSESPAPTATGSAFDTDLEDGRYIVFVKELDPSADPASMRFDLAQYLTGDAANAYAAAHGMETPVPNDNIIVNDNPKLRLMPLAPDVEIDVVAYGNCGPVCGPSEQIDLATFEALLKAEPFSDGIHAGPLAPYWLTIQGDTIVKIEEQYQP